MPDLRQDQVRALAGAELDVLVIGGGVNGAGVLRDLALRSARASKRLNIGLAEQNHFSSGTSGKNSQLIHGGLRYLRYFEFSLVRESLRERAILLRTAPHLVKPLAFLMPLYGFTSRLIYGAGLALYDLLAGRERIARHRRVPLDEFHRIEPEFETRGMSAAAIFYDCQVHSARLVLETVLDAVRLGAAAANYARVENFRRDKDGLWRVRIADTLSGARFETRARKLIDATGAWNRTGSLRLVRGSHIVIPRLNRSDNAIAYFDPAGRIVFLIPWGSRRQLTLVGTTDVDHTAGPDDVSISEEESAYLQGVVRRLYPRADAQPVAAYSSLRPLIGNAPGSAASASRGHRIWNSEDGILHIAGGKYTTYREMSEEACDLALREVEPSLAGLHVTAEAPLAAPRIGDPLTHAVENEMARHLGDYLHVSTYEGYERRWTRETAMPLAARMGALFGWDAARTEREAAAVTSARGALASV